MGSPSIFVYDCNNAGLIVQSFIQFAAQREQEQEVRALESGTIFSFYLIFLFHFQSLHVRHYCPVVGHLLFHIQRALME